MDGHRMSWMPWIAVLATLVIVPAASADHDDDRWYNSYEYGQSASPWDDPGRIYDRNGSYDPYGYYGPVGYWSASDPYPDFDSLRGYGRWQRVPGLHEAVWFPYVAASWRPYYYGHWINTRFGMTWVSYEPWGDVPHHYGHWVYVDHYGWGWVPGSEWGPAWVTWGVVDGYIGWAPLPPSGYRYPRYCRYSPGRHHPDYRWSASFAYDSSGLDFGLWVFVSDRDFHGSSVHSHALPAQNTLSLFKEKRVLPVGRDLNVDYVKRVSPAPVRTVDLAQRVTKTTDGRTIVLQEPRGQESRIREGREATRAIITKTDDSRTPDRVEKTRAGSVADRSPAAPARPEVATGKSREDTPSRPEVATEKSRADAPSRPETATGKSRAEESPRPQTVTGKSRESSPPPSGNVAEKPAPAPKGSKSKGKGQETKVEKRKR